jgi:hypothetical protein
MIKTAFASIALWSLKLAAFPSSVFAQGGPCPGAGCPTNTITLENPLGTTSDVGTLITAILAKLVLLGAPIAGVMVLVGGFQMMFSHGDPEKFELGKKTLLYTAIGYGIILLADGVGLLIKNLLTP